MGVDFHASLHDDTLGQHASTLRAIRSRCFCAGLRYILQDLTAQLTCQSTALGIVIAQTCAARLGDLREA